MAKKEEKTVSAYTKIDLYKSEKYRQDKDILMILLEDDKVYTKDEVDKIINSFKNKPIKERKNGGDN